VVGRAAALLSRRRATLFVVLAACVVGWYIAAPHLPHLSLWWAIALVSVGVMPGTLLLVLVALPLWQLPIRVLLVATAVLALVALLFAELGWGLAGNFAKLFGAVFAGWAFLWLFEFLSWVVLFLAAAARWNLRVYWTWAAMTAMYGLTVVTANAADVGGLPALPFLSVGFLLANADLVWRELKTLRSAPRA
jgi:hypothetical protein